MARKKESGRRGVSTSRNRTSVGDPVHVVVVLCPPERTSERHFSTPVTVAIGLDRFELFRAFEDVTRENARTLPEREWAEATPVENLLSRNAVLSPAGVIARQQTIDFLDRIRGAIRRAIDSEFLTSLQTGAVTASDQLTGNDEWDHGSLPRPSPRNILAQPRMKRARDLMLKTSAILARQGNEKSAGAPSSVDYVEWYRETQLKIENLRADGVRAPVTRAHEAMADKYKVEISSARAYFDQGKRLAGAVKRPRKLQLN
jgi:hypothetical protein